MARLKIDGIDGVMAEYNRRGNCLRPIITEALEAGASVLKEKLQDESKSSFKQPSGELAKTIDATDPWHHEDASGVYVYPQGNYMGVRGTKLRRAGDIGFVLEYGRGNPRPIAPNPWNKRAMRKSAKRINSIIVDELGGM